MTLAAALFLAAFLLFQVQPMLGKALLPWFGGTPAVWTVCLLFFQALLLGGYAYAHIARRRVHLILLAISLAVLPIAPKEITVGGPTPSILLTLLLSVGLPYFVLSSASPLLQRWSGLENPYRLYALSNFASLLALISYPIVIEPWLALGNQFRLWSVLYGLFAVLCGVACWRSKDVRLPTSLPVAWRRWTWWIVLAGTGSALLAAMTTQMCQEVAPIPFLWIGPMVIYLASFILTFERPAFYQRQWFSLAASIFIPVAAAVAAVAGKAPVSLHLLVDSVTLFLCLIILHGELALARPEPTGLTRYYLAMSIGGLAGGVFVALAAPMLFRSFAEFPLLLSLVAIIAAFSRWRFEGISNFNELPLRGRAALAALAVAVLAPLVGIFQANSAPGVIATMRDFYGVIKITEFKLEHPVRVMTHGRTTHGMQFQEPRFALEPTTYYSRLTGAGMTVSSVLSSAPDGARIGVVGLGTGTLAAYGRPGDLFRFYELNPQVIDSARRYFTFLSGSKAKVEVAEGDARVSLARETSNQFDALIIDAFSSDSIPVHLLTAECATIYRKHLKPNGRLIIHISNRTLDLDPVVRGVARYLGMNASRLENNGNDSVGMYPSTWMVLSGSPKYMPGLTPMRLWRDDFASLWGILK